MAEHNELGNIGEMKAVGFLKANGYRILDTNWRKGRFELDVVAEHAGELVFVEVKTRSAQSLIAPEESVDRRKIRHIVAAADKYVKSSSLRLPVRFDIIAITGDEIEHIKEAFYPPLISKRR